LTESEAAIPSHSLYSAYFLDGLLKPKEHQGTADKETPGRLTALAVVDNRECCTFAVPGRCGTILEGMSADN
jgi:hypothetical protein